MNAGSSTRLYYEPINAGHADVLFKELLEPQIYQYIDEKPPDSLTKLRQRFEKLSIGRSPDDSETWLNWVLRERVGGGSYVGYVQATVTANHSATIAYVVFPKYWKLGFGTEAVRWLLATLANSYGVQDTYAIVDRRNKASLSLLAKLGFGTCSDRKAALETDTVLRLEL